MSSQLENALNAVDLFARLSRRQVKKLIETGSEVRSQAGKELAKEGLGALAFHVVLDGVAEVSRGGQLLSTLAPGDYFGEISMIDGKPRSATVTAASELRTFAIPHSAFALLLEKDTKMSSALLVALCARIRNAEANG